MTKRRSPASCFASKAFCRPAEKAHAGRHRSAGVEAGGMAIQRRKEEERWAGVLLHPITINELLPHYCLIIIITLLLCVFLYLELEIFCLFRTFVDF